MTDVMRPTSHCMLYSWRLSNMSFAGNLIYCVLLLVSDSSLYSMGCSLNRLDHVLLPGKNWAFACKKIKEPTCNAVFLFKKGIPLFTQIYHTDLIQSHVSMTSLVISWRHRSEWHHQLVVHFTHKLIALWHI